MQENEHPLEARTGCYKIEYSNEQTASTEKELFDTVFSKLEKIQKQAVMEKIKEAERQLLTLEEELDVFIAHKQCL